MTHQVGCDLSFLKNMYWIQDKGNKYTWGPYVRGKRLERERKHRMLNFEFCLFFFWYFWAHHIPPNCNSNRAHPRSSPPPPSWINSNRAHPRSSPLPSWRLFQTASVSDIFFWVFSTGKWNPHTPWSMWGGVSFSAWMWWYLYHPMKIALVLTTSD